MNGRRVFRHTWCMVVFVRGNFSDLEEDSVILNTCCEVDEVDVDGDRRALRSQHCELYVESGDVFPAVFWEWGCGQNLEYERCLWGNGGER